MFKKLTLLTMLLGTSTVWAQGWTCNSPSTPTECNGSVQEAFSSREYSCLLKLYTCGRYDAVIDRIDSTKIGLSQEQNYFLGAAYFGLSNRTDAQSLRCLYIRRAKAQLEEFIVAVESNTTSKATYGTDQKMDTMYQAIRIHELLKKEPGCMESSFSEGSIYRMAQLMTHQQLKSVLHDSSDKDAEVTGAKAAIRDGFQGMRSTLNSFVTGASKLESRYYLYQAQLTASTKQYGQLGKTLEDRLGKDVVTIGSGSLGLAKIEINNGKLNEFIKTLADDLNSRAITPLAAYEKIAGLYFSNPDPNNPNKYYDELRQEKLASITTLISVFAGFTNTLRVTTDEAKAIQQALTKPEAGFETPALISTPMQNFFNAGIAKYCKSILASKYWYCRKGSS